MSDKPTLLGPTRGRARRPDACDAPAPEHDPPKPAPAPVPRQRRRPLPCAATAIGMTVDDTLAALGIGRTTLYALLAEGRLQAVKIGTRTVILADSVRRYLAELPTATFRTGLRRPGTAP